MDEASFDHPIGSSSVSLASVAKIELRIVIMKLSGFSPDRIVASSPVC